MTKSHITLRIGDTPNTKRFRNVKNKWSEKNLKHLKEQANANKKEIMSCPLDI